MWILSELYCRNCNLFSFQTQKFLILIRLFLSVRISSATKQILCHSVLYVISDDVLLLTQTLSVIKMPINVPTLRYHIISKCLAANVKLFFIPQGSIVLVQTCCCSNYRIRECLCADEFDKKVWTKNEKWVLLNPT